jgi:hypothetical protein
MEDSRLKKIGTGILTWVFIFTFIFPIIPLGGIALWDKIHPSNASASVQGESTATDSTTDTNGQYILPSDTDYSDSSSNDYYDDSSNDYSSDYDYSNDTYDGYTNVDGNYVPSPNYTGGTVGGYSPTYTCADGTYSYAQHSQGACSHHGGIN